jgi:hypothetical protein
MSLMHRFLTTLILAGSAMAADHDSAVTVRQTVGLFPYEIGLGGLIAVTAAFFLGRMCRPSRAKPVPAPIQPTRPIEPPSSNAGRPINLIRRLDELEKLRDLGVLTPEECEVEKHKLRRL